MPEGVPQRADAIAVELVGHGRHRGGAGLHRLGVHGVGVVGEIRDRYLDRLVGRGRHEVVFRDRLAQRDQRVTDQHLGMRDRPVGEREPDQLLRVEGPLVEVERDRGILHPPVGSDRRVPVHRVGVGHGYQVPALDPAQSCTNATARAGDTQVVPYASWPPWCAAIIAAASA